MKYDDFLKSKVVETKPTGLNDPPPLNDMLFPFQRDIVNWALRLGRAAIFADCGLGKTPMQLEWAKHVPGRVLILAPLAVAQQTCREGEKFGVKVDYARHHNDSQNKIVITNYEMLDKFRTSEFAGVVLDESSILKSFMGKTKTKIIDAFRGHQWKLACTATPAPNDHMEIGNHADFLDIMPSNEMLSRWFINDTMNFGTYRLKGYAIADFWRWVSSWAVSASKPSDMGYSDEGFNLPPLNMVQEKVGVDQVTDAGDGELFRFPDLNATNISREMRITAPERCGRAAELVNDNDGTWIVWCHLNVEADLLKKLIPDAVEVRGSDSAEKKERLLGDFGTGKARVIITKPSIAGFGLNWQHCSNVVFVGLNYSYEMLYQAIRRSYRFGQERQVNCHIIMADTQGEVIKTIARKMEAHKQMQKNMYNSAAQLGIKKRRKLKMDYDIETKSSDNWEAWCGDSVEMAKNIKDEYVDFSIFSPPFANLYIYSDSRRDMGNCADDAEFMEHFGFLIGELYRMTRPGRLCAVHCKNLVNYKGRDGRAGLRDFRGEIIRAFEEQNWQYHSEVTIWKDPVIEMQRTKAHGLLYKQLRKDSTFSRNGMAEYLVIFRKWANEGDDVKPVTKTFDSFPLDDWQESASPTWETDGVCFNPWLDIRQTNVLNVKAARSSKDEKHICPLQLDVIQRAIKLWTNEGDMVYSPFMGIGSEGYVAVGMGRKFLGMELKRQYFDQAVGNLIEAEKVANEEFLFDMEAVNE